MPSSVRRRLPAVVLAAGLGLTLTPTSASAAAETTLGLRTTAIIVYGRTATLVGELTSAGNPVPNRTIRLSGRATFEQEFVAVAETKTDDQGRFTFKVRPIYSTIYRAVFNGGETYAGSSRDAGQAVRIAIPFEGQSSGTQPGHTKDYYGISGNTLPAKPNKEWAVYRRNADGKWVYAGIKGKTNAKGNWVMGAEFNRDNLIYVIRIGDSTGNLGNSSVAFDPK